MFNSPMISKSCCPVLDPIVRFCVRVIRYQQKPLKGEYFIW